MESNVPLPNSWRIFHDVLYIMRSPCIIQFKQNTAKYISKEELKNSKTNMIEKMDIEW